MAHNGQALQYVVQKPVIPNGDALKLAYEILELLADILKLLRYKI